MNKLVPVVVIALVGCNNVDHVSPSPPVPANAYDQLLAAHNKIRAEKGIPLLVINPQLVKSAGDHAVYMDRKKTMAHEGIGDGTPWSRITTVGYSYRTAGENVAMDPQGIDATMTLWVNSPGHLANILGHYTDVGFGISGAYYCTDFGSPSAARLTQGPRGSSMSHSQ